MESTKSEQRSHASGKHRRLKSSPFDGKKSWKVWYKRFRIGTKKWSREERLEEMLQLMKGPAAVFVFDQLPESTLTDYKALKAELKNRYRKVENPDTYAVMFTSRNQQSNESVQDFAAELTMLYDKAHPRRDAKTRCEDLMRRWLDGIKDRKSAKQVEFVKSPATMEDAIDAYVKLQGLNHGSHSHKASRTTNQADFSSDDEDEPEVDVRYVKPGKGGSTPLQGAQGHRQAGQNNFNQPQNRNAVNKNDSFQNNPQQGRGHPNQGSQQDPSQQTFGKPNFKQQPFDSNFNQPAYQQQGYNRQPFNQYNQQAGNSQQNFGASRYPQGGYSQQQGGQQCNSQRYNQQQIEFRCFKCGGLNHMANQCPSRMPFSGGRTQGPYGQAMPRTNTLGVPQTTIPPTYQQQDGWGSQQPSMNSNQMSPPNPNHIAPSTNQGN